MVFLYAVLKIHLNLVVIKWPFTIIKTFFMIKFFFLINTNNCFAITKPLIITKSFFIFIQRSFLYLLATKENRGTEKGNITKLQNLITTKIITAKLIITKLIFPVKHSLSGLQS